MRYACLHLPALPLEAHLRARPARRREPIGVVEHDGPAARLIACSEPARARGLSAGMGVARARRREPRLRVLVRDRELERFTLEDLEAVAAAFTPALEAAAPGTLHLDATGVAALFGSERDYGVAVLEALARRGLRGRVGIASTRTAARVAAGELPPEAAHVTVVPAGEERAFLAPLPPSVLEPPPRAASLLEDLGLRRCADLQALTPKALRARLGDEGVALGQRARGEDPTSFAPAPPPTRHARRREHEEPLDSRHALERCLAALLDELLPPLVERGLSAGRLRLTLELADGGVDLRVIALAQPTREAAPLQRLVQSRLERRPPRGPVAALEVELTPEELRPRQLSLFLPAGPSPRELSRTVSRLEGLVGPARLGAPLQGPDHRPAGFGRAPFRPPPPRTAEPPPIPLSHTRALRPPRALRVRARGGIPDTLEPGPNAPFLPRRMWVVRGSGPWELSGAWWTREPFRRRYFELEIQDGRLLRVYQELPAGSWWLDGIHD